MVTILYIFHNFKPFIFRYIKFNEIFIFKFIKQKIIFDEILFTICYTDTVRKILRIEILILGIISTQKRTAAPKALILFAPLLFSPV